MWQRNYLLWGSLLAVAALYVASRTERGSILASDVVGGVVNALTPRGYRNKNPGNIEWVANPVQRWRGMVKADGRFGVFDTPQNGVRAIGGELKASIRKNQRTVAAVINEWAPPTENDTSAYVAAVASDLGVKSNQVIDVYAFMPALARAIAKHENGYVESSYDWNWVYLT